MQKIFIWIISLAIMTMFLQLSCTSRRTPEIRFKESSEASAPILQKVPMETEWEKVLSQAKKERQVVVYMEASSAGAKDNIIKMIRQNFGLETEIVTLVSGDLNTRVFNERRAGLYYNDIIITGGNSIASTLQPAKIFVSLKDSFILPEVIEQNNWREGKMPWFDSEQTILATALLVREGATINTTMAKKENLKSYMDLLDSRWKGNIVMHDPTIPGKGINIFQTMAKIMGMDFLKQLSAQQIIISRDHRQLSEWLGRGKYAIGLAISTDYAEQMRRLGTPLDYAEFKEGAAIGSGASLIGTMDNSPHPQASRIFINWFLSKEGQTLWSKGINLVSRRADVPTEHLNPVFVPKTGVTYLEDTLDYYQDTPAKMKLAKEILGM